MFGLTGVLIALVVLTIVLAAVFLVRPSITAGATGKILAFLGLCVLPALCIGAGMSFHMQRSQQTSSCISCHSMASHGQSLHLEDPRYIPAQHFQNHLVPPDKACYTCHTDYTIYGPWKSRLDGLRFVYLTYIGTVPKTIHLKGKYSNLQCLHCHLGTRNFEEHLNQMPPLGELTTNHISCISSGCHDMIHNASEVGRLKMWTEGVPSASVASAASPTAGASKAPTGSSAGSASAAGGKGIFDSQGCGGCHGPTGGGGTGPALTHVSSLYPPAKLTAVLKAPTAKMKSAGMVPLTLSAADMKSLVAYVTSLGGASASAATPPASGSSSPAAAKAEPTATADASKVPTGGPVGEATAALGKSIYHSHGCGPCHGETGAGGAGPALTHISSQYPPAELTAILKTPTAGMKAAGMIPVTLNATDMRALVSYVTSLGGSSAASAAPPPASGPSSTASANSIPAASAGASKATDVRGRGIFDSQGCGACHGSTGGGGTGPALSHISSEYPPAKLTAVLKAPTAKMKSAGMVPLTLSAADMKALVSYVTSLGGP